MGQVRMMKVGDEWLSVPLAQGLGDYRADTRKKMIGDSVMKCLEVAMESDRVLVFHLQKAWGCCYGGDEADRTPNDSDQLRLIE